MNRDTARAVRPLPSLNGWIATSSRWARAAATKGPCRVGADVSHWEYSRIYHVAHIWQLRTVAEITNDAWFSDQADLFASDTAPPFGLWPVRKRDLAIGGMAVLGILLLAG